MRRCAAQRPVLLLALDRYVLFLAPRDAHQEAVLAGDVDLGKISLPILHLVEDYLGLLATGVREPFQDWDRCRPTAELRTGGGRFYGFAVTFA